MLHQSFVWGIMLCCLWSINLRAQIKDSRLKNAMDFDAELDLISTKIGPLPDSIRQALSPLKVQYYSFDKAGQVDLRQLHEGVLVVHESVREDLKYIFQELEQLKFPIQKVVPVHLYGLNRDTTGWNDQHSMQDNNTSAFNYRYITNSDRLSPHALGIAIDFNPLFNPFESYQHDGKFVEPQEAYYTKNRPGTISDSLVVGLFDKRGWIWGGRWNNPVDYQHFDKRPRSRKHFIMKESALKDYFQYGDGDGSIALFAEPYYKKRQAPEIFLEQEAKAAFLYYAKYLSAQELYRVFKKKGTQNWSDFIKDQQEWELKVSQEATAYHRRKQAQTHLHKGKLAGKRIVIQVQEHERKDSLLNQWNLDFATALRWNLQTLGAEVLWRSTNPEYPVDLTLVIDLGNIDMYHQQVQKDNFQLLYVPGAWRVADLKTEEDRVRFLQALLSDQLPKSVELAKALQAAIVEEVGLAPVSRQLPGPNVLETASMKTELDGIYCRYFEQWKSVKSPMVVLSLYSVYHPKVQKWMKQGQFPSKEMKKMLQACRNGVLNYLSSVQED